MKNLIVEEKYNNKNLKTFLLSKFDGLSLSTFHKSLRKKDIKVNNVRVNKNITLHTGDFITVFIIDDLLFISNKLKVKTIYEDNNILIVDKPAGIEVTGENSLSSFLSANINNFYRYQK